MKIPSVIMIIIMIFVSDYQANAQTSRHETREQKLDRHGSQVRHGRKHKIKKYAKMHRRSMHRIAKADGKITKGERKQMRQENKKFCRQSDRVRH
jgi:uncharacterized membrane protein YebE (DUF533 family)